MVASNLGCSSGLGVGTTTNSFISTTYAISPGPAELS